MVVKIGGSTLGSHDTTLEDLVELQRRGAPLAVIHGGGRTTTEWLGRLGLPTRFANGLRVTDGDSLKVVVAVLSGLLNKELVVAIQALGGKAVGLSGSDGGLLRASVADTRLGYVGEVAGVDPSPLQLLLGAGYMPVVAPVSLGLMEGRTTLLNVNGDAAAGEIAAALAVPKLVFLSDVDGIHGEDGRVIARLSISAAKQLVASGVASGGMLPKIAASFRALTKVAEVRIVDGRSPHALLRESKECGHERETGGTTIVRD